eukprot:1950987-Amphidinium_carterae.1
MEPKISSAFIRSPALRHSYANCIASSCPTHGRFTGRSASSETDAILSHVECLLASARLETAMSTHHRDMRPWSHVVARKWARVSK